MGWWELNHCTWHPTHSKLLAISQIQSPLRASASPFPPSSHRVRPGQLLLRRPFLKTLFNAASPQNLDTWPCFVCFEAVTIISYFYKKLVYCLFLCLKCKPHGIGNYASALFAFSTDPSTEVNAQYFLNKLINCLTKIQIWYWGCFPWIFWLNRTEVKPKAHNKSTSGDLDDQANLRITLLVSCYSPWPMDQQPEHHQGACHKCRFSALPQTHWIRTGISKILWWSVITKFEKFEKPGPGACISGPSLPSQWEADTEESPGHWQGLLHRPGGRNGSSLTKITSSIHHISQSEHVISRLAILTVWSPDRQHQYHLATCKKYKLSDPISKLLN